MKVAIYARTSTKEQNIETQLVNLREYCKRNNHEIYKEYVDFGESGKKDNRPAFNEMLEDMRKGKFKAIIVYKLDRIGRSLQHLIYLFEEFNKRGIHFISTTQPFDTTTSMGRFQLQLMMLLSQYERELTVDRVKSGLERARKQGKTLGRPKKRINMYEVIRLLKEGNSLRQISRTLNVPVSTLSTKLKLFKKEHPELF